LERSAQSSGPSCQRLPAVNMVPMRPADSPIGAVEPRFVGEPIASFVAPPRSRPAAPASEGRPRVGLGPEELPLSVRADEPVAVARALCLCARGRGGPADERDRGQTGQSAASCIHDSDPEIVPKSYLTPCRQPYSSAHESEGASFHGSFVGPRLHRPLPWPDNDKITRTPDRREPRKSS
jgi:hypothetical protein